MKIYIPTLGRNNKQITFNNLPTSVSQAALIGTGSLYLSGSTTDGRGQFLCVFTG